MINRIFFSALFIIISVDALSQYKSDNVLEAGIFSKWKLRCIGPSGLGRISAIGVTEKNPNIVYVGTAGGGVWKTIDGGASWESVFDEQPVQAIGAIAVQKDDPNTVWVGTGDGNAIRNTMGVKGTGIYKSVDGGKTWRSMGLEKTVNIYRIVIDFKNPDIIYVAVMGDQHAAHAERGVYKTTNGGKTWEQVLFTNDRSGCAELVMNPQNSKELYAAMYEHLREPWRFQSGGKGSGLYKTTDGGKKWQKFTMKNGLPIDVPGRMGIAISIKNPSIIYSIVEAKEKAGIYKSSDKGKHWKYLFSNSNAHNSFSISTSVNWPYFSEIYCSPMNENTLYSLDGRLRLSYDGGNKFSEVSPKSFHSDYQAIWINPLDSNHIMLGDDGWFGITHDGGKTWSMAETIIAGQAYEVNTDDEIPYNVMGGFQDNGSMYGPAYYPSNRDVRTPPIISNITWKSIWGGDGFSVLRDDLNARIFYAMCQNGFLAPSNIFDSLSNNGYRFGWNTPITKDPFNVNALYVGSQYLLRTEDVGIRWRKISPDLTGNDSSKWVPAYLANYPNSSCAKELIKKYDQFHGEVNLFRDQYRMSSTISSIAPSKIKKGLVWIGSDDGNIKLTRNEGKTWIDCTKELQSAGLPTFCMIEDICASELDADIAYIVAHNYRQGDYSSYLFKTIDGGHNWQRIADDKKIGGVLLSVIKDPVEPNLLFVGAHNGLWVSIDGGNNYHHWKDGLVQVPVTGMTIQKREADLVLATWGRSFFVLDDITPLRELARNPGILKKPFYLFKPMECRCIRTLTDKNILNIDDRGWPESRQRENLRSHHTQDRPGSYSLSFFYNKSMMTDTTDMVFITVNDIGRETKTFKIKAVDGFNRVWVNYETESSLEHSQGLCKATAQCGLLTDSVEYSLRVIQSKSEKNNSASALGQENEH